MTREETKNLLPIIMAYIEGKDVQFKTSNGIWISSEDINFLRHMNYRINPEPQLFDEEVIELTQKAIKERLKTIRINLLK